MDDFQAFFAKTKRAFALHERDGVRFLTVPLIDRSGVVKHGFSTRIGGVSTGFFSSLNFSMEREKNAENFKRNIDIFSRAVDVAPESLVMANYAHSTAVVPVGRADAGKGVYKKSDLPVCDGLVTDTPGLPMITLHADCAPLVFADVKHRAAGIAHAGWRGAAGHIAAKMIEKMQTLYQSSPIDILAAVGPCIGPCCFEVQADVEAVFLRETGRACLTYRNGKIYADLKKTVAYDMYWAGLDPENVNISKDCTCCRSDLYFSYRRDRGNAGAMALVLEIGE